MIPWIVYSVAELEQAFAAIPDGGRIELAPGDYAHTTLSGRDFVSGVTITSTETDDRAVFTDRLLLQDVGGVTLDAIEIEAAALAPGRNYPRLTVQNSTDVAISDVRIAGHIASATEGADPFSTTARRLDPIAGFGQDIGLNVPGSTGVTITGVEMTDLRLAISVSDARDITIRDVEIHGVREGINTNDVRGLLIEDSVFRNFTPWNTGARENIDHADMIQFWAINSAIGVHDLTIRNNIFRQDAGDPQTQTIFGHARGADAGVTMTNFTIDGNTIVNGHTHGISITDVTGVRIVDNVLLPKADLADHPEQVARPMIWSIRNDDVEISGNTLVPLSNLRDMKIESSTDVTVADDNVILSYDPANPLFWRTVLEQVDAGTWTHGGADHAALDVVPEGRTDAPTDADTILTAAREAGWAERTADPAGALLDPGHGNAILIGGDGNDWLRGRGQDTVMVGGGGADRFSFDFRDPDYTARHVVLDLDWSEDDDLRLLTPEGKHFVKSQAQLDALVADGTLVAVARDDGMAGPLLQVADRPDQKIDLVMSDMPDVVPEGRTDAPTDADTILTAAREAGWAERTADPAGALLDPGHGNAILIGGDGNDWLRGRGQDTVMVGGGGADRFSFDFRDPDYTARHVVLDLDWSEDDDLRLLTPEGKHFVKSQAQLDALVADGTLVAVARDDGMAGPLLQVADRPDQKIDLVMAMTATDMLDWIG